MTFREVQVQQVLDVQWGDTKTTKSSYVDDGYVAYSATGPDGFLPKFDYDCDGVVLSAIGANCGSTFFATNKWSCIKNTIRILPRSSDIDLKYFYFLTKTPNFWPLRGSAQPFISQTDIREMVIKIPDLATQKKIGEIIYGLELSIETYGQIAETLEEIAQAIFKSWFIDFDAVKAKMAGEKPVGMDDATAALFPDSMEDSALGPIPKGWKCGTLEDAILILDSQRIPLSSAERKKRPGNFPYYGATGILDFIDSYLFEGPHVLVGEDGSVITKDGNPFVQYVWGKFWVSNHAHVLQGSGGFSVEQLKLFLDRVQISNYVTGAVQPKLNQGNLKSIPCLLPEVKVSDSFNLVIGPMFEEIRLLSEQTKLLVETRDRLLPRLISGELQIPEEVVVS